ncbi:MAG: peptidase C39 family protein [Chitinophagaceae bacterium]|nr:peptidase C39 family protein [Chitinophagaceae bacterium]
MQQQDSMDCGPACLAMICKYYKKSIPIQILRDKTQIGKEGVNLLGISEAAESIGFRTKSVRLTYKELFADALTKELNNAVQKNQQLKQQFEKKVTDAINKEMPKRPEVNKQMKN